MRQKKKQAIERIELLREKLRKELQIKKKAFADAWFPGPLLKEISSIENQLQTLYGLETEFYDGDLGNDI